MRTALALIALLGVGTAMAQSELDNQNVVWTTPSRDASGAMPLGNGEVGINLWVEENGDLLFYVSRTDAWSEASRLLKLGRVRVKIDPNPFKAGKPFRQELRLREGKIHIDAGDVGLDIFVDTDRPVIHIRGDWSTPHQMTASLETWRTQEKELKGRELASSWTMQDAPIRVAESADTLTVDGSDPILYHRNRDSIVPFTLKHQGLEAFAKSVDDPLKDRFFGLRLQAEPKSIAIAAESKQIPGMDAPKKFVALMKQALDGSPQEAARKRTEIWWNAFWKRSWIFVKGDTANRPPSSKHRLRIGFDSGEGNRFDGKIRDAVVYDRPLSDAEIEALPSRQPANPVLSTKNDFARRKLAAKSLGGKTDVGYAESLDPAPFDLSNGFTVAARITPDGAIGRIFDMLTAGQSDGFLFDTHPGFALRTVVGDRTFVVPNILEPGKQAHVSLTVAANGRVTMAKDGKVVFRSPEEPEISLVTRGYTLQRYMNAIGGRGNYPIKFNGSIFTVEPTFLGEDFDPDWRKWGDCYWWQNTRLPYFAMPAAGDYDLMLPLFKMYGDVSAISRDRAKSYYGAQGIYFPETMTIFGTYANKDYGWDRTGHKPSEVLCPWWQYAWQQSLELLVLMLEYQAPDEAAQRSFEARWIKPMGKATLDYFTSRFKGKDGTIRLSPTQAVETYWYDVVNDTPTLAGLHDVTSKLVGKVAFDAKLTEIPIRDGKVAPAESYKDERSNVENPEFYAIWPFRLYGVGRNNLAVAQKTFRERIEKANTGWQYDGQVAALCGLTEEARDSLLTKVRNSNPSYRWPATWGPNYDWLPDQCHGGNIMLTLQSMCLQEVGDKLYILPAFPKEWDVNFKLHASRGTTVEVEYAKGKLISARVKPDSRQKDLVTFGVRELDPAFFGVRELERAFRL